MKQQQRNVPARIEVYCPSDLMQEMGKNRVVFLVDPELEGEFKNTVCDVYLRRSNAWDRNDPVIGTFSIKYSHKNINVGSFTDMVLGRKRIKRVDPYPRQLARTLVFDNRMSNFTLSPSLKKAILASHPNMHPSVLQEMTTFGDILDAFGPARMKTIVRKMAAYC